MERDRRNPIEEAPAGTLAEMRAATRTKSAPRIPWASGIRSTATLPFLICAAVAFVIAAGLVLLELATPTGLYGVTEFDDAVYFAAARHLVEGALPYRDYTLIQPPGIAVLLSPIALLSHAIGDRSGLGLARILTGLVVGLNAAGVVWLLRRFGLIAAAIGGLALAIYPTAFLADHTLMLEPYLMLFCLIGAGLAFPPGRTAGKSRMLAAGCSFGVAGSIKVWAILPILAMLVVLIARDRKGALRFLIGTAIAAVVLCGVFFLEAPHAFVHDVITSQLGRATRKPTSGISRLFAIDGLADLSPSVILKTSTGLIALVTSLVGGTILLGSLIPSLRRRGSELEAFVLLSVALTVAAMFYPEQFFYHYAYFTTPFVALGLGIAVSRAVGLVRRRLGLVALARRRRILVGLGGAVLLGISVVSGLVIDSESHFQTSAMRLYGDPGPRIQALIPKGACVVADAEALLTSGDRVVAASASCPIVIDSTGTWLAVDPLHPPIRSRLGPKDPRLVAFWAGVLRHVDYLIVSSTRSFRIPWTPSLRAELARRFDQLPGVGPLVYKAKVPIKAA